MIIAERSHRLLRVGSSRSRRRGLPEPEVYRSLAEGSGEEGQLCDLNALLLVLLLLVSVVVREVVLLRDERADDDKEDGEGGEPRGQHAVVDDEEELVERVGERRVPRRAARNVEADVAPAVLERLVARPPREVSQEVARGVGFVRGEVVHPAPNEEEVSGGGDGEPLFEFGVLLALDHGDVDPVRVVRRQVPVEGLEFADPLVVAPVAGAEAHEPVARRRAGRALRLVLEVLVVEVDDRPQG